MFNDGVTTSLWAADSMGKRVLLYVQLILWWNKLHIWMFMSVHYS